MSLKDGLIQSAVNKVRSIASGIGQNISNSVNDNQGWVRGGKFTPVQQVQQLQSQSPVSSFGPLTIPNFKNPQVKQIYSSVNTPEKQQQFNQQPVKGFGQNLNSYVMNNYVAPITQVPYNAKQVIGKDKSLVQRGVGALGVLSGTLAMVPDPIGDIALPAYNYLKGVTAAQKRGEGTLQSYKTGITSLTGQKPVGLGEALSSDPAKQNIGNIAELPLMFAVTGKLSKKNIPIGSQKSLDNAQNALRKYLNNQEGIMITTPEQLNNITKRLANQDWRQINNPITQEAIKLSRYIEAVKSGVTMSNFPNIGSQTRNISKEIQKGVDIQSSKGVIPEVGGKPNIPNTEIGKVSSQDGILPPTKQTELPVSNKVSQSQDILSLPEGDKKQIIVKTKTQLKKVLAENPNANVRIELTPEKGKLTTYGSIPDRQDVAATLPNRLNTFVEDTLGYSNKPPKTNGGRGASLWTRTLRKGQTAITTKIEEGLGSENPYIRNASTFVQNFFRGLGMSPERAKASMQLRGEMSVANQTAYNVMDELYKSLGNNKKSLEKINAVLDPGISKLKVSFDDLSKTEKQVYGLIREGLDLVHDTSYANGHISAELYAANKGKYTPRLYDVTELPTEVNKFVTQGSKKINNDLYKQRKDVDAWKQDNSLNDPVYALGKRLSQVQTNTAIRKYTDFLASNQRFVSDVERPGFTKLSDSPAYGELSGKYVLNSAAEDLKGFFFANQGMQNLYDAFRAYDRMPIRQLQKKLLTVFNPTTNVGNIVSDQVFGWVTGVDPFTLNKNLIKIKNNPAEFKQLSDYLMKQGITGTDITRTDFVNKLASIDELAKGTKSSKFKIATDKVQQFYGGTDDIYKVSALKSLLDKGFTLEEATRKVADGFQNYANVGKFYDLAAKTPIIGKPFIKFQGDLIRIIKNGAVNNPLGLISFLGTLKAISYLSSKASGETDEDRKTRENRFAAPMIPGLNIPLTWQTPIGEINVARYISPFYANNETTNMFSNMIPGIPNIDTKKDVASNVAMNVNDPLLSPLVQLGVNRDFRGKPISDPNENKYQPSTLTEGEKLKNQALFAGRAYLPPPVNSAIDVGQVATTGKNMYGSPQTVGQSIARLGGIKISDMSAEQVQNIRDKDSEYQQKSNEYLQKQIQSVKKEQLTGGISQETANNRIANLESQKKDVNTSLIKGSGDEISYINDNGNMGTINLIKFDDIAKMPSTNKYETALKEGKQFSSAATILDNTSLTPEQKTTVLKRLGIDEQTAKYYQVANDNTNLKTLYVMDKVQNATDKTNLIEGLANLRKQVNGQMIASNTVLDNLVDEGIISKSEATELKKYKFEGGKLTSIKKTGTKAKKGKKIKVSIKRPPKLKALKTKAIKIKTVKTKTYKPVKFKIPKKLKVKKIAINKVN